jgi:hypothetical protein
MAESNRPSTRSLRLSNDTSERCVDTVGATEVVLTSEEDEGAGRTVVEVVLGGAVIDWEEAFLTPFLTRWWELDILVVVALKTVKRMHDTNLFINRCRSSLWMPITRSTIIIIESEVTLRLEINQVDEFTNRIT